MILHTMAMLNTILDNHSTDEQKQSLLIRNLGNLLFSLFIFFSLILIISTCSLLPFLIYTNFNWAKLEQLDFSYLSYIAMLIGSTAPFLLLSVVKTKGDYTETSMLLHRMILDNGNISKQLFFLEKKIFSSKKQKNNPHFIIISGLARSGTSALTTLLHESGIFHSLSYANMPFTLSPNAWSKLYSPTNKNLKERAHGDKVLFGYSTIEALEEVYFKTFLHDGFIQEKTLSEHNIDEKTYNNYLHYQQLLKRDSETTYLAKNNNFILRYRSLRSFNKDFKVVFLFRHPIEHAYSLFKQHQRFSKLHQEDPFTLEYMNWLAHHEFGMNLKYFQFATTNIPADANPETIEYWIHVWINYSKVILNLEDDPNRMLVQYEDFLHTPVKVIAAISEFTGLKIPISKVERFENTPSYKGELNQVLQQECLDLYQKLAAKKSPI
ncbi:sulfotransferase domain-containing protein [Cytophaga aurantiaca]|uniref:sulfotransferase domain-containing protein n=1 Tax=Cytophaga aurantiaca TaxID=29530 RepID=UPI001B7FB4F1|nr:sulfotransferase domain-containing protein [Cytophaga aurantiaca]